MKYLLVYIYISAKFYMLLFLYNTYLISVGNKSTVAAYTTISAIPLTQSIIIKYIPNSGILNIAIKTPQTPHPNVIITATNK